MVTNKVIFENSIDVEFKLPMSEDDWIRFNKLVINRKNAIQQSQPHLRRGQSFYNIVYDILKPCGLDISKLIAKDRLPDIFYNDFYINDFFEKLHNLVTCETKASVKNDLETMKMKSADVFRCGFDSYSVEEDC